jgi:hypothetical protein
MAEMVSGIKSALVGAYVTVRPTQAGERKLFGLYVNSIEGVPGMGRVFEFSTQLLHLVADENCCVVPRYNVTGGLLRLPVHVPGFGDGTVIAEWVSGSSYRARVRDAARRSTVATIMTLRVLVPTE